jgi:hypothetical protein
MSCTPHRRYTGLGASSLRGWPIGLRSGAFPRDVATRGRHNVAHLPAGSGHYPIRPGRRRRGAGRVMTTAARGSTLHRRARPGDQQGRPVLLPPTEPGRVWVGALVPGDVAMDLGLEVAQSATTGAAPSPLYKVVVLYHRRRHVPGTPTSLLTPPPPAGVFVVHAVHIQRPVAGVQAVSSCRPGGCAN